MHRYGTVEEGADRDLCYRIKGNINMTSSFINGRIFAFIQVTLEGISNSATSFAVIKHGG